VDELRKLFGNIEMSAGGQTYLAYDKHGNICAFDAGGHFRTLEPIEHNIAEKCFEAGFRAAHELLAKDAERLDYLQAHLLAADFDYGERNETVLVFQWPATPIGANLRADIDSAIAAQEPK